MIFKFPVYIISKGRYENCLTAKFMAKDGTPFKLVVEPQEQQEYTSRFGVDNVLVLPFSNLGLGSIPARNWVWEHAKASGYKRHWIFDDNINQISRRYKGIRIRCNSSTALSVIEELIDRYENIGLAGMAYEMFIPDGKPYPPFVTNVHVYSNFLILNLLSNRWRGKYNEDTDLCLQVLAEGWCTLLTNAFIIKKRSTMTMKGGNTDELYKGDGRLDMAKSLERLWPGVVQVKRRYGRPQHIVDWKKFKTPLRRRVDIDFTALRPNEFGLKLVAKGDVKHKYLRGLLQSCAQPEYDL
jgi:hypothetical protein